MSDFSELRKEVGVIGKQVVELDGFLRGTIKHLATKDDLTGKISLHQATYHGRSVAPARANGKFTAVILGAIGALTATVIALTQLL